MADGYNAARANPTAACAAVNVDLNEGLPRRIHQPRTKAGYAMVGQIGETGARVRTEVARERGAITHDLDGITPVTRANADGWYSATILENAGVSCTDQTLWNLPAVLKRQVDQYIAHAGHRAQMFDERTSNVGVGVASGYWQGRASVVTVIMMASEPMRQALPIFGRGEMKGEVV